MPPAQLVSYSAVFCSNKLSWPFLCMRTSSRVFFCNIRLQIYSSDQNNLNANCDGTPNLDWVWNYVIGPGFQWRDWIGTSLQVIELPVHKVLWKNLLDMKRFVVCVLQDCGTLLSEGDNQGCYPLDGHVLCKNCNTSRIQALTAKATTDLWTAGRPVTSTVPSSTRSQTYYRL